MSIPPQYSYSLVPGLLTQNASNKSTHSSNTSVSQSTPLGVKQNGIAQHPNDGESSSSSTSPIPILPISVLSQTRSGSNLHPTELSKMFSHIPNQPSIGKPFGMHHQPSGTLGTLSTTASRLSSQPLGLHRSSHTQSLVASSLTSGASGVLIPPNSTNNPSLTGITSFVGKPTPGLMTAASNASIPKHLRHFPQGASYDSGNGPSVSAPASFAMTGPQIISPGSHLPSSILARQQGGAGVPSHNGSTPLFFYPGMTGAASASHPQAVGAGGANATHGGAQPLSDAGGVSMDAMAAILAGRSVPQPHAHHAHSQATTGQSSHRTVSLQHHPLTQQLSHHQTQPPHHDTSGTNASGSGSAGDEGNIILPMAPPTLSPVPSLGISSPAPPSGNAPTPIPLGYRNQLQPMSSVLVVQNVDNQGMDPSALSSLGHQIGMHPMAVQPGAPLSVSSSKPQTSMPFAAISPLETGGVLVRNQAPAINSRLLSPDHHGGYSSGGTHGFSANRRITSVSNTSAMPSAIPTFLPTMTGHPAGAQGGKTTAGPRQPALLRPSHQQQQQQSLLAQQHLPQHPQQLANPNQLPPPQPALAPLAPSPIYYQAQSVMQHNIQSSLPSPVASTPASDGQSTTQQPHAPSSSSSPAVTSPPASTTAGEPQYLPPAAQPKLLKRIVVNRELAQNVANYSSAGGVNGMTPGTTAGGKIVSSTLNQNNKRPRPPGDPTSALDDFIDAASHGAAAESAIQIGADGSTIGGPVRRRHATPYTPDQKNVRLARWYEKRNHMLGMTDQDFQSAAVAGKYTVRKKFAEERPRKGGRFIKKSEADKILQQQRKEEEERQRRLELQRKDEESRQQRLQQQQQQQQQPHSNSQVYSHPHPHHMVGGSVGNTGYANPHSSHPHHTQKQSNPHFHQVP